MVIDSCGATHRGNVRKKNQDNIYVDGIFRIDPDSNNMLIRSTRSRGMHTYGVFDGLGGGMYGEKASLMASQMLKQVDEEQDMKLMPAFFPALQSAISINATGETESYTGTTAAVLMIDDYKANISNIGDSRVYLFRDGRLKAISYDHTIEQSLIEYGILQEPDRGHTQFSHELSQFVGMVSDEELILDEFRKSVDCRPGDVFILCSDGLTDAVSNEELAALLEKNKDKTAEQLAVQLLSKALKNNSRDNVSVIVVKVS